MRCSWIHRVPFSSWWRRPKWCCSACVSGFRSSFWRKETCWVWEMLWRSLLTSLTTIGGVRVPKSIKSEKRPWAIPASYQASPTCFWRPAPRFHSQNLCHRVTSERTDFYLRPQSAPFWSRLSCSGPQSIEVKPAQNSPDPCQLLLRKSFRLVSAAQTNRRSR